jgi:hypothetical protein
VKVEGVSHIPKEGKPEKLYSTNPIALYSRGGKNMSQEEGKTKNLLWWAGLIALLILVIVGGL